MQRASEHVLDDEAAPVVKSAHVHSSDAETSAFGTHFIGSASGSKKKWQTRMAKKIEEKKAEWQKIADGSASGS
jgi:hypothetical protein